MQTDQLKEEESKIRWPKQVTGYFIYFYIYKKLCKMKQDCKKKEWKKMCCANTSQKLRWLYYYNKSKFQKREERN